MVEASAGKSNYPSVQKKLSRLAEPACSLYLVPSKRSVKPALRALIPRGIQNITTDAKVIFVLSLQ